MSETKTDRNEKGEGVKEEKRGRCKGKGGQ